MKKFNSNIAVGWIAWFTLVLMALSLGIVIRNAMPAALLGPEGFFVPGIAAVTLAGVLGIVAAVRSRYFGLLIGLVIPNIFATAFAVRFSISPDPRWQAAALAVGLFFILLSGRIALHLVNDVLLPNRATGRKLWFMLVPVFIAGLAWVGWAVMEKLPPEHLLPAMRRIMWFLIVWALFLVLWRPTLFLRAFGLILLKTVYRVRVEGLKNYPGAGPVLLVANHVSFLDALMILCLKPRRVTFMVHRDFYRFPVLYWFFRWVGALEVPRTQSPKKMRQLFDRIHHELNAGGAVCVFPEGSISSNGILQAFKNGVGKMLPDPAIPVVPIRLGMLWGSWCSSHHGHLKFVTPHKLPIPASIMVGKPIPPDWSGFQIWQKIAELGAEIEMKPSPGEKTIHYRFLKRAKQHPFKCTFKDAENKSGPGNFALLVKAIVLSRKIREIAAERGDDGRYVGVMLPNRVTAIATLLAVQYADRTPALLNYTVGADTLKKMCVKAKLKTILTSRLFVAKLKMEVTPEMVFLEDLPERITGKDKRRGLLLALLPHRLLIDVLAPRFGRKLYEPAVVLFSSGSTGAPKGVLLSHRNVNCDIMGFWSEFNWQPKTDRLLGNLPLFHAFGTMICYSFPTVTGVPVSLLVNPLDSTAVCRTVRDDKVSIMVATPTFLRGYMRNYKPGDFDSLRLVVTGAEKLQRKLFDSFHELTGLNIVEGYGCTELSPIVSINLSRSLYALGRESGPFGSIGVAMPGIAVRTVNPDTGAVCSEDQEGVLQVKSGITMLGYLDDPEATAAAITPDGYYNTNDVATIDRNGYIRIIGRLSRFSKIGGEMVPHEMVERKIEELTETENKFAVTCRADARKGEQLIILYTDDEVEPEKIVTMLREAGLPNLWIPRADCFYKIETIPMLGNGKKDLRGMRALADTLPLQTA